MVGAAAVADSVESGHRSAAPMRLPQRPLSMRGINRGRAETACMVAWALWSSRAHSRSAVASAFAAAFAAAGAASAAAA